MLEPTPVGALALLFCLYMTTVAEFTPGSPSSPSCANITGLDHSFAAIVSVVPLPAAVAAQT